MRNIDYSVLAADKKGDSDILNMFAKVHEYRGRQDLYIRQKPVNLIAFSRSLRSRVQKDLAKSKDRHYRTLWKWAQPI